MMCYFFHSLVQATAETTIGFIKEAPALSVSGFNVYHKNRLIRVCFGNSQGNF